MSEQVDPQTSGPAESEVPVGAVTAVETPAAVAAVPIATAISKPVPESVPESAPAAEEPRDPIILGFLCEWAAGMSGLLDDRGVVTSMPNVRIIRIPCSGMAKPAWLEMAVKQGADGVFVCGCPIVDCHFREGNVFIRDRVFKGRTPKPKRLDAARVRGYWYEQLETEKLLDDLRLFTDDLRQLNAASK